MVVVSMSETYDLSTKVGKVGLIGIHTPQSGALNKLWSGFMRNYRFVRILGCDVTLACASMLPADPLQIGTEAGDIAPQDMFNPILYKAVSNDSFNYILARMYALQPGDLYGGTSLVAGDLYGSEELTDADDEFNTYYALLGESGWKKAMPQSGLSMRGLYPIVHQVLANYGQLANPAYDSAGADKVPIVDETGSVVSTYRAAQIKGPSMRYPRVPTVTVNIPNSGVTTVNNASTAFVKTFVGCLVLPPAKLNKLFYRMKIVWHYEFTEPRPDTELMNTNQLQTIGHTFYTSDYAEQSSKFEEKGETVDTNGLEMTKVMTTVR